MLNMFLKYMIIIFYTASFAMGADILAIIPTASFSHQVAFFDLWSQLSLRGHKLTVITANPQKNETMTNMIEIDTSFTYKFSADISDTAEKLLTMWNFHQWVHNLTRIFSEATLSHHQVQDLIHGKKRHFDVLLVEWFYPELLAFSEIYNCPTIQVASLEVFSLTHSKIGNPTHPSLYPDLGTPFNYPLSLKERIISTINYLRTTYFDKYESYTLREKLMRKIFNTATPMNELIDNVDMLFFNVNPVVQLPRALGPTTINVGSLRQISAKPLPKGLAELLDGATDGFVYFSLGSNVKSKDLQKESLMAILEILGELPFKVLWKFEADPETLSGKPDNVKLVKWAPQLGVLAHSNIKLFVTQGGLQSMEEAIFYEVPCVVIPFFADQEQNAKLMKSKGFAEIVGRHPYINKEALKKAIKKVTTNPKYKKSVSQLKQLSSDTPMTGLEKAIWWTEYVIRNKGAKHLRNPAADLPLYQYFLLDVIGFLVMVAVVIFYVLFILLKTIFSLVRGYVPVKISSRKKLQ